MVPKIHLVIAHPNTNSFNHALAEQALKIAADNSLTIVKTDLYSFARHQHPAVQFYGQQEYPQQQINEEQQKIKDSDIVILQFPLYWFSYPAILQAYLEQIWQVDFAYPPTFEQSPLAKLNKKVLFSITTQSPKSAYTDQGKNGDIQRILFPMTTAFRFVGFAILEPFICYAIGNKNKQELEECMSEHYQHINQMLVNPKIIMQANAPIFI